MRKSRGGGEQRPGRVPSQAGNRTTNCPSEFELTTHLPGANLVRISEFKKAASRAGVVNVHVHKCRHTAACRWLRAGVDIYTVSKLLRHASVVMSERYAHLSQADLKATVGRSGGAQQVVDVRRRMDATTIKLRSGYRS